MGQYYHGVILDAETRKPILATYPEFFKLIESGLWDMGRMVYELSRKGRAYKQRVVWAGDYSENVDENGDTLFHRIHEGKVPEAMGAEANRFPMRHAKYTDPWCDEMDKFFRQYVTTDEDVIREEFRYLCNHDRREYIDLMPFYTAEERTFWNPLAILTSDPTCRCQGGGDYRFRDDFEYYGWWSECMLSSEPAPPDGYKRIAPTFEARKRLEGKDTEQLLLLPPTGHALEAQPTLEQRLRDALRKHFIEAA